MFSASIETGRRRAAWSSLPSSWLFCREKCRPNRLEIQRRSRDGSGHSLGAARVSEHCRHGEFGRRALASGREAAPLRARIERLGAVFANEKVGLAVQQTIGNPVRSKSLDPSPLNLQGGGGQTDANGEGVTVPRDGQEHVPGHDRIDRVMGEDGHTGKRAENVVLDHREIPTRQHPHSILSSTPARLYKPPRGGSTLPQGGSATGGGHP